MAKKLSELELETIAGGLEEPASDVVALAAVDVPASELVSLTGPIDL